MSKHPRKKIGDHKYLYRGYVIERCWKRESKYGNPVFAWWTIITTPTHHGYVVERDSMSSVQWTIDRYEDEGVKPNA